MATATKKAGEPRQVARRTGALSTSASTRFLVFEDNGGGYHWRIVAGDGATLAHSAGFVSYEDAERAARHVRDEAGSASFEPNAGVGQTRRDRRERV
ncbi:MAG TPA: DUF1508 domain-containing protein [Solirubrobacteraceae bacterium]|jgi:uncharacterized protein YegP (UPF0339 family)